MSSPINQKQQEHLQQLIERPVPDLIEFCKSALEHLTDITNNTDRFELLAKKCATDVARVRHTVEALISLQIEAVRTRKPELQLEHLRKQGFSADALEVLSQFVSSKRPLIEGSLQSAYLRSYRLINVEWRLEVRLASRALLQQHNVFVTIKLCLHMEPKQERRNIVNSENEYHHNKDNEDKRKSKQVLLQTDLNNLLYIIRQLEAALQESRSRRIKNIVASM